MCKAPFKCAVNIFTAITFILFCVQFDLKSGFLAAATLWCIGVLLYGTLCLFQYKKEEKLPSYGLRISEPTYKSPPPVGARVVKPAVQNEVRLDHALSIADRLLVKNIGRGDRQELEKLKTTLTVLKVKDCLTPQEGEALNEMFNALLKLMAKYDV